MYVTRAKDDLHLVVPLSLSETSSGWRLTENRAMLSCNEGSFQAHWLDGCRSISIAGSPRGRALDIVAKASRRSQETAGLFIALLAHLSRSSRNFVPSRLRPRFGAWLSRCAHLAKCA